MLLFNTVISVYLMVSQDLSVDYFGIWRNGIQSNIILEIILFDINFKQKVPKVSTKILFNF